MIGTGAGRHPTATSVIDDILEIRRKRNSSAAFSGHFGHALKPSREEFHFDSDFSGKFYIRGSKEALDAVKASGIDFTSAGQDALVTTNQVSHNKLRSIIDKYQVGTVIVVM